MAKKKPLNNTDILEKPAMTQEGRESQLESLAYSVAEQQMRDGTASSQVITHFLKLSAIKEKEKLERQKLENEVKLLEAKTAALKSAAETEKMYQDVINAMKEYSGTSED